MKMSKQTYNIKEEGIQINNKWYIKNNHTNLKSKYPEAILYKEKWIVRTSKYHIPQDSTQWHKTEDLYCFLDIEITDFKYFDKFEIRENLFVLYNNLEHNYFNTIYFDSKGFRKYSKYKKCYFSNNIIGLSLNLEYDFRKGYLVKSNKFVKPKNKKYIEQENYIAPKKKTGFSLGGERRFSDKLKLGEYSPTFLISEGLKYSFGVEIETCSGYIDPVEYYSNFLNMSCDHDGSIQGGEYVTNVLKGDTGFKHLYKITSFLQSRCKIDSSCGIHVHIGGVVFNKSFSVYSYILGLKLQEDLFKMLPKSRRHNKFCSDLPEFPLEEYIKEYGYKYGVDLSYELLYRELSSGTELNKNQHKKFNHPFGRYCGQYHDVEFESILRYKWLNLVPCNFNVRNFPFHAHTKSFNSKARQDLPFTIEFRNHSASLNYSKIKNWVLICMAFVNYVENCKKDIIFKKNIKIEDIILKTYGKNAIPLLKYVEERKNLFLSSNEDIKEEIQNSEQNIKFNKLLCV